MIRESERHLPDQSKDTTAVVNNGGTDTLANMDNIILDENGNTASGKMATGASQQAAVKLAATFNKNKGDMSPYLLALFEFNQWQAEFNAQIKAIEEQICQMRYLLSNYAKPSKMGYHRRSNKP